MLKMFIDDEEVVSKNNLTIKEEILSPSSTILNNTYPKNWEINKDYISNFYMPKDFAKLNIQHFSLVPEIIGTTILINGSATITDVNASYQSKVTKLLGQTSQDTTTGKNLLNATSSGSHQTGLYVTRNSDGSYTLNGTNTGSQTEYTRLAPNFTLPAGTYTLSNGNSNVSNTGFIFYDDRDNFGKTENSTKTFSSSVEIAPYIKVSAGVTVNNQTIYPMIESGSSKTDYEPYTGGIPSPSPSYPQPVHVVSGDNTINIDGKNLLGIKDKALFNWNGLDISISNDEISINGTAIVSDGLVFTDLKNDLILKNGDNYTFSKVQSGSVDGGWALQIRNANNTNVIETNPYNYPSTFNTFNGIGKTLRIYVAYGRKFTNYKIKIMLNKGTTALPYEPYIGQDYPIYLGVENLYGGFTYSRSTNGIDFTHNEDGTISVNGTASADAYSMTSTIGSQHLVSLQAGTYTLSGSITGTDLQVLKGNGSTVANTTGATPITFTLNETTSVFVRLKVNNGTQITNKTIYAQLEKGSKVNHFTPYGTTPIELCKIGDYQDYIYKDNGVWYLHKEIGKIDLGEISYVADTSSQALGKYYKFSATSYNFLRQGSYYETAYQMLCEKYRAVRRRATDVVNGTFFADGNATSVTEIQFKNDDIATSTDFKNSMSGVHLYIPLSTPTTTEITDEDLIAQLEALKSNEE